MVQVGDLKCVVSVGYNNKASAKDVTVTKVGRKYYTTSDRKEWYIDSNFSKESNVGRIFDSREQYEAQQEHHRLWIMLKRATDGYKPLLSVGQIRITLQAMGVTV